jgi:hypothetical protein
MKNQETMPDNLLSEINDKLMKHHEDRKAKYLIEGKNDGRLDIPNYEDVRPSQVEFQIKNDYQADVSFLAEKGLPILDEAKADLDSLHELEKALEKDLSGVQTLKNSELLEKYNKDIAEEENIKEKTFEIIYDEKKHIIEELEEAETNFRVLQNKYNREEPTIHIKSDLLSWVILTSMGLFEVPLNFQVFANFYLPKKETYIVSWLLVIAVPIASHFTGIFLKQFKENPKRYVYYASIISTLMIVLSIFVGVFRSKYIYTTSKIAIDSTDTILFILLSILLYVIGSFISYFHHDKNQEFADGYFNLTEANKRYENDIKPYIQREQEADKTYLNSINILKSNFELNRQSIANILIDTKANINDTIAKYNGILDTFKAFENQVGYNLKESISIYRAINQRSRKNKRTPTSWSEEHPLDYSFSTLVKV